MVYRFGVFEFDGRAAVLSRSDRPVALEPQPARALALLLSRAGEVVSRDELRAHLWGSDTNVDFDRGLAYSVGQLRSALGDNAGNPRFVETLPRRGFRFIAPVERIELSSNAATAELPTPLAKPFLARHRWLFAAAVIASLASGGLWMLARPRPTAPPIIAVAVFDNETGDASHDRQIAALSDVIVDRLTALGPARIGVVGNMSSLRRPRRNREVEEIARQTAAAFLVFGSLQTKDGKLSLFVQLVNVHDGTHLWVQRIARPLGDTLVGVDEELARAVEAAVRRIVLKEAHRA